jgi:hypothetical protein
MTRTVVEAMETTNGSGATDNLLLVGHLRSRRGVAETGEKRYISGGSEMMAHLPGGRLKAAWTRLPVRIPSFRLAWLYAYRGERWAGGIGLAWLVHNGW